MQVLALTGPVPSQDGSKASLRGCRDGALAVQDAHGRYTEAVSRGNVFIGSNLGGTPVTTQAGLSATTPALTLYNPIGSGIIMYVLSVGIAYGAAPAAASTLWLAYNAIALAGVPTAPVATTDANITSALMGSGKQPCGRCFRVATLSAAPLLCLALGGTSGAAAIGGVPLLFDIGGAIGLLEGVALSIQTNSAAVLTASITWEELLK